MNLPTVSKAIAGAIVTMLVAYLAKHGVTLEPVVSDALSTLLLAVTTAAVGYLTVYFAPKNK